MGLKQKSFEIRLVGLVLASLVLFLAALVLPLDTEARPSPADPGQACLLPASNPLLISALLPLLSSVISKPQAEPEGASTRTPGCRAELWNAASGRSTFLSHPPARDLRQLLLRGIPLGANAPPWSV